VIVLKMGVGIDLERLKWKDNAKIGWKGRMAGRKRSPEEDT
jgi:hypothetical protein